MLIKVRRRWEVESSEITDERLYRDRRRFIRNALALGAGLVVAGCDSPATSAYAVSSQPAVPAAARVKLSGIAKSPYSTEQEPTSYEDITSYNNFYEFGTGKKDPARNAGSLVTRPRSVGW